MSGKSKVVASSAERYRASAAERRQYGGNTVTVFYVYRIEDAKDASRWLKVRGYGATPGARKIDAIKRSGLELASLPPKESPKPSPSPPRALTFDEQDERYRQQEAYFAEIRAGRFAVECSGFWLNADGKDVTPGRSGAPSMPHLWPDKASAEEAAQKHKARHPRGGAFYHSPTLVPESVIAKVLARQGLGK